MEIIRTFRQPEWRTGGPNLVWSLGDRDPDPQLNERRGVIDKELIVNFAVLACLCVTAFSAFGVIAHFYLWLIAGVSFSGMLWWPVVIISANVLRGLIQVAAGWDEIV